MLCCFDSFEHTIRSVCFIFIFTNLFVQVLHYYCELIPADISLITISDYSAGVV